jgi:hypothetical protein
VFVIQSPSVRTLRFLPLVFLVGIDGFAMFAPYLLAVLVIGYGLRKFRSTPQPQPAPVLVESEPFGLSA